MGGGRELKLWFSDTVESVLREIINTLRIDAIDHLMIPQRIPFLNMPYISDLEAKCHVRFIQKKY